MYFILFYYWRFVALNFPVFIGRIKRKSAKKNILNKNNIFVKKNAFLAHFMTNDFTHEIMGVQYLIKFTFETAKNIRDLTNFKQITSAAVRSFCYPFFKLYISICLSYVNAVFNKLAI